MSPQTAPSPPNMGSLGPPQSSSQTTCQSGQLTEESAYTLQRSTAGDMSHPQIAHFLGDPGGIRAATQYMDSWVDNMYRMSISSSSLVATQYMDSWVDNTYRMSISSSSLVGLVTNKQTDRQTHTDRRVGRQRQTTLHLEQEAASYVSTAMWRSTNRL